MNTHNEPLSNFTLYLMSVSAGLVVANIYYNQPLLNLISIDFGISESKVSAVALTTQIGYALGLLFIIPLGDKISNLKILRIDFVIMIFALLAAAVSNSLQQLILSSLVIGISSSIPQLFVPMAAQLSDPKNRGRAIGIVMSGLLIGIIGSRVISGIVGEFFGWRAIFFIAAFLMLILFALLNLKLPRINPKYKGTYFDLMKSILYYFKTEPSLRLAAFRGALSFGALSAFWTTLVFLMEHNFNYGSAISGLFGLVGIVGAVAAGYTGRLNDNMDSNKIIYCAIIISITSWLIFLFSAKSIIGIVIAVVLVDLGQQSLHISNQNIIFSKNQDARNRVNTVYMVTFFLGGSIGAFLGPLAWQHYAWTGVSILGLSASIANLLLHYSLNKST